MNVTEQHINDVIQELRSVSSENSQRVIADAVAHLEAHKRNLRERRLERQEGTMIDKLNEAIAICEAVAADDDIGVFAQKRALSAVEALISVQSAYRKKELRERRARIQKDTNGAGQATDAGTAGQ